MFLLTSLYADQFSGRKYFSVGEKAMQFMLHAPKGNYDSF